MPPLDTAETATAGSSLLAGRYAVGEIIGHGGMSEVREGVDTRLGRPVAIKLLRSSLATEPSFRSRFRQEAQAAARMSHPTIVRVFDAGEETVLDAHGREQPQPFIVMERVEGRTLKDVIDEGPLEPDEAIRVARGVLTALEYSHRAGVVHRDIKPGNVMITRTGQVKVMDFGIARAVTDSSTTVAQTTAILGTAAYFSPEQAKGESVDARTDLYSMGVVLFQMLTGRVPFLGSTPVAVAYQHVSDEAPAPSSLAPRVSPALDAVVSHALAKGRFDRYQSAAEFARDLDIAASGRIPEHTDARSRSDTLYGVPGGGVSPSEAALRQLAEDDSTPRVQSRPPVAWVWAGILSVAVIVIALLFWVFTQTPVAPLAAGTRIVPSVVGKQFDTAVSDMNARDLKWKRSDEASSTVDAGHIIRTDPEHGTSVSQGATIDLFVSSGPQTVSVPSISGLDLKDARAQLKDAGLVAGSVQKQNSATVPGGVVVGSQPGASQAAKQGDTVDLIVSSGMVTLPDLTGMPMSSATNTLADATVQLRADPEPDASCPLVDGTPVRHQSLAPGDVPQGSTVTLTYCSGSSGSSSDYETSVPTPPADPGDDGQGDGDQGDG